MLNDEPVSDEVAKPKDNAKLSVTVQYVLLFIFPISIILAALYVHNNDGDLTMLVIGSICALGLILITALYPIAIQGYRNNELANQTIEQNHRVIELLSEISAQTMISETAKRIAFRDHDRDALREAIRLDIEKDELDAALVLSDELSETYGFKEEGEEWRQQILTVKKTRLDQKVVDAIQQMDLLLADHKWIEAETEANKIQRLYPESHRVKDLSQHVINARNDYKHELERQFLEAARREDVETAMDLLTQLDHYLTEKEAAPLQEVARGVIGKKRQNLGVQFKLAVNDHDWIEAVRVGEQVIRDFPNTRMGDEVRSMLDLLRERAAGQRAASKEENA